MATVGVDCDLALFHTGVAAGAPYGFILERRQEGEPVINIQRQAEPDAMGRMQDVAHLWFTVLIADDLLNPDGSRHGAPAAEMYARLSEILLQHHGIGLVTRLGVMADLHATGPLMIENLFPAAASVTVQLTTQANAFPPAPRSIYLDSIWVDESSYAGVRNWGNSYWRA